MGKKPVVDPVEKIQEWEEHMYNPGYWINRFTPFFPPKRTKKMWILALIDLFVVVPTVIILWWFVLDHEYFSFNVLLIGLLPVTAIGIITILRAIRLRPEDEDPPQRLREKWNRERKSEEKEHPKRRKDYK